MSEATWMPALIIGGAALAIGAVASWIVRRRSPKPSATEEQQATRVATLETRRDEIYARLRDDDLGQDQRQRLEDEAAILLRDLDTLTGSAEGHAKTETRSGKSTSDLANASASASGSSPGRSTRRAAFAGFASGVAATLLVVTLINWAGKEAKPRDMAAAAPPPAASQASTSAPAQPFHEGSSELSAEIATQVASLKERMAANPADLSAAKQLAFLLLINGNLVEAFDYSKKALEMSPDDPDGLYVQGVVRIRMGQVQQAIGLLDRVLEQYPNHLLALIARGSALQRGGSTAQAIETWQRALTVAGGSHPEIERMIAEAQGAPANSLAGSLPQPRPQPPTQARPTPSPTETATATTDGSGFAMRIELAPGASQTAGATLFLSLRAGDGGPPAAARKVVNPTFPLEITLGQGDSMLGGPLPSSGNLTARLDADGNALTRSEGDLSASSSATAGASPVTLRLGG